MHCCCSGIQQFLIVVVAIVYSPLTLTKLYKLLVLLLCFGETLVQRQRWINTCNQSHWSKYVTLKTAIVISSLSASTACLYRWFNSINPFVLANMRITNSELTLAVLQVTSSSVHMSFTFRNSINETKWWHSFLYVWGLLNPMPLMEPGDISVHLSNSGSKYNTLVNFNRCFFIWCQPCTVFVLDPNALFACRFRSNHSTQMTESRQCEWPQL